MVREGKGPAPEEIQTPEVQEEEQKYKELSGELGRTEALAQILQQRAKDAEQLGESKLSKASVAAREKLISLRDLAGTFVVASGIGAAAAAIGDKPERIGGYLIMAGMSAYAAKRLGSICKTWLREEGGFYEAEEQKKFKEVAEEEKANSREEKLKRQEEIQQLERALREKKRARRH